jgi:LPS sulfotransferase NodH
MRLPKPFYRLPVRFDVARLQEELEALPNGAWAPHPNAIAGNSSVRLISAGGGENDDVDGTMLPTPHLQRSPYLKQVLASFGVVWSRSRLLRLAPGAGVPEHADINYHWFNRVRLHVPVKTRSEVRFYCGDQSVHMAAGEAWLFDNWRLHRVENPTNEERIHLVADTSGSSSFWQFVADSVSGAVPAREVRFDASSEPNLLTEHAMLAPVMTPAEVDLLLLDLRSELVPADDAAALRAARYHTLLDALCRDWRQLYALHGAGPEGWPAFARLRDSVRSASRALSDGIVMRTNRIEAHRVLEGRVLRVMLPSASPATAQNRATANREKLRRPVFIVAAPRSGSTLLFETLAVAQDLFTLGGEAHALVEGIPQLRPGASNVESNRLAAEHAADEFADQIVSEILRGLRNSRGEPAAAAGPVRFLEKTPKNVLRIPFFDRIFPDACYIFLWRDPRDNISSIIEAWRSGQWKTYNGLPGFDGPWSLLLPPGWRGLNGRPLQEIAAFQWESANRIALDDLAGLPRERWLPVRYEDLCADPTATIRRICEFAGIEVDRALAQHVAAPLPMSRYTLTPPAAGKWRNNQNLVERVLPSVQNTWNRLRSLR